MKFEPSLQLKTRTTPGIRKLSRPDPLPRLQQKQNMQNIWNHYKFSCKTRSLSSMHSTITTSHSGLCIAISSNTSTVQTQIGVWGDVSFAPTRVKSQQGLIVYHGVTSNQKNGGNLVQWRSSRQDLIAKSTCEAELIASSEALQQGENIAIVVAEMTNKSCEIEVSSDNAASLHMIRHGSETAWRTRRISVKAPWMHQCPRRGIKLTYQLTAEMAANSLTKGLGASRLPQIREDLCLVED